jgi:hypothetical protein
VKEKPVPADKLVDRLKDEDLVKLPTLTREELGDNRFARQQGQGRDAGPDDRDHSSR